MKIIISLNRKADLKIFILIGRLNSLLYFYEVIFDITIFSIVLKAETQLNV